MISLKEEVIKCDGVDLIDAFKKALPLNKPIDEIQFICIGTDRSTGDSLGPIVGYNLTKLGYTNVMGTISLPLHAVNLQERTSEINKSSKTIIAIDACLGQLSSVGRFQVGKGPIRPGAGVNKDLGEHGDYHITGIVNVGGFMEYFVLQNTRLSLVIDMAEKITEAIQTVFPLEGRITNGAKPKRNTRRLRYLH